MDSIDGALGTATTIWTSLRGNLQFSYFVRHAGAIKVLAPSHDLILHRPRVETVAAESVANNFHAGFEFGLHDLGGSGAPEAGDIVPPACPGDDVECRAAQPGMAGRELSRGP